MAVRRARASFIKAAHAAELELGRSYREAVGRGRARRFDTTHAVEVRINAGLPGEGKRDGSGYLWTLGHVLSKLPPAVEHAIAERHREAAFMLLLPPEGTSTPEWMDVFVYTARERLEALGLRMRTYPGPGGSIYLVAEGWDDPPDDPGDFGDGT